MGMLSSARRLEDGALRVDVSELEHGLPPIALETHFDLIIPRLLSDESLLDTTLSDLLRRHGIQFARHLLSKFMKARQLPSQAQFNKIADGILRYFFNDPEALAECDEAIASIEGRYRERPEAFRDVLSAENTQATKTLRKEVDTLILKVQEWIQQLNARSN